MIDTASGMRARGLLRRHITATIALGVFAGLAGGVALGTWAAARRTATSYDRFLAYENASNYMIYSCPVGVAIDGPDSDRCRVQSLPLLAIATIAGLVLLVANIAAFAPGVSAARTRPASTLRAE